MAFRIHRVKNHVVRKYFVYLIVWACWGLMKDFCWDLKISLFLFCVSSEIAMLMAWLLSSVVILPSFLSVNEQIRWGTDLDLDWPCSAVWRTSCWTLVGEQPTSKWRFAGFMKNFIFSLMSCQHFHRTEALGCHTSWTINIWKRKKCEFQHFRGVNPDVLDAN